MTSKLIALLALILLAACATKGAPAETPDSFYTAANTTRSLAQKGQPEAKEAFVELVLKNPGLANAPQSYEAAAFAMGMGRLEDAAFLYYSAQVRGRVDLATYPTTPGGAGAALGALSYTIGAVLNPAIANSPEGFERVTQRIRSYNAAPAEGYVPGWTAQERLDRPAVEENARTAKAETLEYMTQYSSLLNDPTYFAAFRVVQAFNMASPKDRKDPARKAAFSEAEATLVRIESERGAYIYRQEFEEQKQESEQQERWLREMQEQRQEPSK